MSDKQQTFFHTTEILSIFSGTWVPGRNIGGFKRWALIVWDILLLLIALVYYVCDVLMVKQALKETKKFFRHIGMLLTLTEALVKYAVLRMNQKKIQKVRETLLDDQYNYQSCGSFQPEKMFNDTKSFCKRMVIIIFSMYFVVVVTASTSVLLKLNRDSKKNSFGENITCYDFMPYSFVIPFPTPTITSCKYALIFMDASSCILGCFLATYDTTFTSILICIKVKLKILCEALKSIRERALSKLNRSTDADLGVVDPQLELILYGELRKCAKHLDSILSVCAETENIFKYVTLLQMLDSLLVMASCMFVASLISQSDPEFFAMAQYMLSVLTQLLTLCYFGNEITEVSSTLSSSLYLSDWLNCSERYKQCMIIMMCRMQKKLCMTIGKFSPLTLNTFLSVVKGSFSYCAVFQQLNK